MTGNLQVPKAVAERRQLTVLFCDLVGSTRLSEQLDPEEFRELIQRYQAAAADVIARYEGHIAQYLGDGLLVYFGHPAAHDDDAERAVRAAYDVLRAVRELEGRALVARAGVHTGTVVVGQMGAPGRHETLAVGEATNLAAKLQAFAEPDTAVISHATMRLVPGMFVTRDLGEQVLDGVDKPLRLHQVIQPSGVRTRLEGVANLTPFVGRQQELALLHDRWEQVREGQGQAVLLIAEAGLGKSRLLLAFRDQVKDNAHSWLECRCSPLQTNSAFAPSIELLARGLHLKEGDTNEIKLQRLEQAIDALGQDRLEAVPLLAPLLNLKLAKPYARSPYGAELRRKKILNLLTEMLMALARHQPMLIAIEDLHWADPSSLELLNLVIERAPSNAVMVVFTARPEFQLPWPVRPHLVILALAPLRAKDSGSMLASLTGDRPLPAAVHEKILERANGVPLFLEEITKAVLEAGEDPAVPATLQDSLAARIDRLAEAKPLIQLCSVIGREIPHRLLSRIADTEETTLERNLKTLTDAQLLYARGSPPEATYLFKHALIRDTAYNTLLKSTRQKLHGAIGSALESHFPERRKNEPELLALHFEKAQQAEQAVRYYTQAARNSEARMALREGLSYVERALEALVRLPVGSARDLHELELLQIQATAHLTLSGFAHPEVKRIAARSRQLINDAHDPLFQFRTLGGLWVTHHFSGEFEAALATACQIVALGQKLKMPVYEAAGHAWQGMTLMLLGQFQSAEAAANRALPLCDLAGSKIIALQGGADPMVAAVGMQAFAHWAHGYPERAAKQLGAYLAYADAVGVPSNSCVAASYATMQYHMYRVDPAKLLNAAESALELCQRYGHANGEAMATRSMGVARCRMGQFAEGLVLMRDSIKAFAATGSLATLVFSHFFLAEECLRAGTLEEARSELDAALHMAAKQNHGWWLAEMHRIDGELRLAEAAGNGGSAETCFARALDISRAQGARALELRAAMSLARLWQQQGRIPEARRLLQPLYGSFTEGFDTPDLKDAKALLDALA